MVIIFSWISIVPLAGLMIGTVERYLIVLSLVIPLGSPLESPNNILTSTILGISLVSPIGSLLGSI